MPLQTPKHQALVGYHFRFPALESIDKNEPIVFNWPVGDSVYITPSRSWTYGQAQRRTDVAQQVQGLDLVTRPIDKKDHYIKRCVAVAGDTLQIIDRQVYINGKEGVNPSKLQYIYSIESETLVNARKLDQIGIDTNDHPGGYPTFRRNKHSRSNANGTGTPGSKDRR